MGVPDEARPNPGFYRIPNPVVDSGLLAMMNGSDLKMLNAISFYSDGRTRLSFPSIPRLEQKTGLCRETVQAAVKRLISYGLIEKHRYRKGGKFYCVYRIIDNPIIKLPYKPKKSAGKERQFRQKSGRFGALSKNPTSAYQPEKTVKPYQPEKSAMIKKEQNLIKNTPLPSPEGGNASGSRPPEASLNQPKTIDDKTIKTFMDLWGPERLRDYLRDNNYPIPPEVLLACNTPAEGGS